MPSECRDWEGPLFSAGNVEALYWEVGKEGVSFLSVRFERGGPVERNYYIQTNPIGDFRERLQRWLLAHFAEAERETMTPSLPAEWAAGVSTFIMDIKAKGKSDAL